MPYIHPSARASYRHWWEQQTQSIWWYEDHPNLSGYRRDIQILYPHLFEKRRRRKHYKYTRTPWIRPWDISTSGESRFVQSGYAKKEPDQCKADWREHKQFERDKAKRKQHRRCDHAGRWGKRMVHRARRQWERECIEKERFDEITQGVQDLVRVWWD